MTKKFTKARILNLLKKYPYGISRRQMAEQLDINLSTMAYHWNKLLKEDKIQKIGWCLFVPGEKTSAEPRINVHAMQLTFPIIKDESRPEFWDKVVHPRPWQTVYYKSVQKPIGFTIQKNPKTIQIQVWARDLEKPEQVESLAMQAAFYAFAYLSKNGIEMNVLEVQKKNVEIAIPNNDLKGVIGTKDKIEIDLGRPAKPIFASDESKPAKAYYDPSPGSSVETNDIEYGERYLRTPEMVMQILEIQNQFADQLKLHLEVEQRQAQNQEKMNQVLDKIAEALRYIKDSNLK